MKKFFLTLTLAVMLPIGVAAQNETAEMLRRQAETLELVELARTDREAATLVFSGVREAAAQIAQDPANREALSFELDAYFDQSRDIIAGAFGPVPDATRDMIAEAFVQLAIAKPNDHYWHYLVAEAGQAGYERVDQALFEIYSALREREHVWASVVLTSYAERPAERALPYLSRVVAQQDDDVGAMTAIEIMAATGPRGADAILELEDAGTVNDYVWQAIRAGSAGTDEVCPHVPTFTPCVQNEILGSPRGTGTLQISCRDLPSVREAFPPDEYEAMFQRLCGRNH